MYNYTDEALKNAAEWYDNERFVHCARLTGDEPGFMAQVRTEDRTYFVVCTLNPEHSQVTMDLMPGIQCPEAYLAAAGSYIAQINDQRYMSFGPCHFGLEENGCVYVRAVSTIPDCPLASEDFKNLFRGALELSDVFEANIQKICSGQLLSPGETVMKTILARMQKHAVATARKRAADRLNDMLTQTRRRRERDRIRPIQIHLDENQFPVPEEETSCETEEP